MKQLQTAVKSPFVLEPHPDMPALGKQSLPDLAQQYRFMRYRALGRVGFCVRRGEYATDRNPAGAYSAPINFARAKTANQVRAAELALNRQPDSLGTASRATDLLPDCLELL